MRFEFNLSKPQTRYISLNPTYESSKVRGQALWEARGSASSFGGQDRPEPFTREGMGDPAGVPKLTLRRGPLGIGTVSSNR